MSKIDRQMKKLEKENRRLRKILKNLTEWNLEDALAVEREEGIEEGIEKGREENLVETVKNLLDFGMKPEQISRALKLPPDTVQRYLDER